MTDEVKFVVRDTFSFMDARYKEDWWEYGGFKPDFSTPLPTSLPVSTPTPIIIPSKSQLPPPTSIPTQVILPPTAKPQVPTQTQIQITLKPVFITATPIPTPTITPTPKPLVDIKNTITNAKSAWSKLFAAFINFSRVILP